MDHWYHVMQFLPWPDCVNFCKAFPSYWEVFKGFPKSHIKQLANTDKKKLCIELSSGWYAARSVIESKCDLCFKSMRTRFFPIWNVHAHHLCFEKQLIERYKARDVYDLSLEDILRLPCDSKNRIWKYNVHCLRAQDTLEGVVQERYGMNLKKRKQHVLEIKEHIKHSKHEAKKQESQFYRRWNKS